MNAVKFPNCPTKLTSKQEQVKVEVESFLTIFKVIEKGNFFVFTDLRTDAFYSECHLSAQDLVSNATIDVPLDPENQADYRANREAREDHAAYKRMVEDANKHRSFSNIVCEYNTTYDTDKPIKIIGGQHRFMAIEEGLKTSINELQGVKIYFKLDKEQRLDVQLISNTNIAVSTDLLDRMFETSIGPELRTWCQSCGLLERDEDFADKKQRGSQITVRGARAFIINYYEGKKVDDKGFDKTFTTPVLPKTGVVDDNWEHLRKDQSIWQDSELLEAGRQYAKLHRAQTNYYKSGKKEQNEFSDKAIAYSVLASWAYVAGLLNKNKIRLQRHYSLGSITSSDPLSAKLMANARHRTDPDNYRGLGTRTDEKERGRLAELFFLHGDKGGGLTKPMIDLAVKKYHAKQSFLEVEEAERKLLSE